MRRIVAILVVTLVAVFALTPTASAGQYKWTGPLCSTHTTDVRGTVCTQVQYYKSSSNVRKVTRVYVYWSRGAALAYNVDNMRVYTGGAWRGMGSNVNNYTSRYVSAPYTSDSACFVRGVLDGWAWFNATFTHWHRCW